jgi:hypothetical protein
MLVGHVLAVVALAVFLMNQKRTSEALKLFQQVRPSECDTWHVLRV